jgi:hypothetical protein
MWGVKFDDPMITELAPLERLWYFEHWIKNQEDQAKLAQQHAFLLASFDHPEEVRKMTDESSKFTSTDAELEESMRLVKEGNEALNKPRKRKRKIVKE